MPNNNEKEKEMRELTDFGWALDQLREGYKVSREGWNGKGMWLTLVPGSPNIKPVAGTPYSKAGIENEVTINPHVDMMTATGEMQPGWLASQTDMLAIDWGIVELTKSVNTNLCPSCGDGNNHFKICINPNCPHGNYAT